MMSVMHRAFQKSLKISVPNLLIFDFQNKQNVICPEGILNELFKIASIKTLAKVRFWGKADINPQELGRGYVTLMNCSMRT